MEMGLDVGMEVRNKMAIIMQNHMNQISGEVIGGGSDGTVSVTGTTMHHVSNPYLSLQEQFWVEPAMVPSGYCKELVP